MILACKRCGRGTEGTLDACYQWRDEHVCVEREREPIRLKLVAKLADDMPHGDWRRYRSASQHCECHECHMAYLDYLYDHARN